MIKFKLSDEVMAQEINGETVLLDLASEQYFGLDVLGTRIWRLLEQEFPLNAIIEQLLPEFEVDREQFVSDVNRFVSELLEAGLISR